jgi:hypothetical protein
MQGKSDKNHIITFSYKFDEAHYHFRHSGETFAWKFISRYIWQFSSSKIHLSVCLKYSDIFFDKCLNPRLNSNLEPKVLFWQAQSTGHKDNFSNNITNEKWSLAILCIMLWPNAWESGACAFAVQSLQTLVRKFSIWKESRQNTEMKW